jgi:hypothetical protein
MDAFSYLSVLISVVLGFAITQVLQGYRALLIARRRVRFYFPALAWAALVLLMTVQSWWATFAQFMLVLLQCGLTYMLAALIIPDIDADDTVDLEAHYFEQAPWFFGFGVALLVTSIFKDRLVDHRWPDPLNFGFHMLFLTLWGLGACTRNRTYHGALPWLTAGSLAAYVWLLFSQLAI